MQQLNEAIQTLLAAQPRRLILSKPRPAAQWRRVEVRRLETGWQLACYTDTQVFHENLDPDAFGPRLEQLAAAYGQLNGWSQGAQWSMLISKKGMATLKRQADGTSADAAPAAHNRQKRYLLAEGQVIPPLVDMGVFTPDGRVVRAMYDKFRQINRFLELVEDETGKLDTDTLHIIDFGCGKSYLTFVLYYYFTQVKKMRVEMVGLDLKADVIEKCNAAAQKYGYEGLRFELGDINGYKAPFAVDMVVTLHACDTATDYALFNAVEWGAKMIFSVPCCQHELNRQMDTQNLPIFGRYGIVRPDHRRHPGQSAPGLRLFGPAAGICGPVPHPQKPADPGGQTPRHACGQPPALSGRGHRGDGAIFFAAHPLPVAGAKRPAAQINRVFCCAVLEKGRHFFAAFAPDTS